MAMQIIVPLDQSHIAECAVPYARALARRTGGRIILLSAVEPSSSLPEPPPEEDRPPMEESSHLMFEQRTSPSMPIGANPGSSNLTEDEFDEITSALKETEDYLSYVGDSIQEVAVEKMIVYGDPAEQVVKAGESADGDEKMIVMASHGRSGLGRVLLGSVALKVAERATCPMFVVRALRSPVPAASDISFNKAMIALDGSGFSEEILDPVQNLFGDDGAALHLVRVVNMNRSWATGDPAEPDEEGRTTRDDAEEYLSGIADRLKTCGFSVTWDVCEGDPAQQINKAAEDSGADVVALATHGYSGLKRLRIGSVAEEVLNRAVRPLIMVRPAETHGATH